MAKYLIATFALTNFSELFLPHGLFSFTRCDAKDRKFFYRILSNFYMPIINVHWKNSYLSGFLVSNGFLILPHFFIYFVKWQIIDDDWFLRNNHFWVSTCVFVLFRHLKSTMIGNLENCPESHLHFGYTTYSPRGAGGKRALINLWPSKSIFSIFRTYKLSPNLSLSPKFCCIQKTWAYWVF